MLLAFFLHQLIEPFLTASCPHPLLTRVYFCQIILAPLQVVFGDQGAQTKLTVLAAQIWVLPMQGGHL